eukprot:gene5362-7437_t
MSNAQLLALKAKIVQLKLKNRVDVTRFLKVSEPLYEVEVGRAVEGTEELTFLHQFVLFSSLDLINSAMWTNNAT